MQRGARELRDRRLQRIEEVIQRSSVCWRNVTISASSSNVKLVERDWFRPIGTSCTCVDFFHLPSIFGLRWESVLTTIDSNLTSH
jgi:hypothetical protein